MQLLAFTRQKTIGVYVSRLTDLLNQLKQNDPRLATDLEKEFKALSSRRAFGLNFERHRPENVELYQRPIRKGDKVRVLPPRGDVRKGDQRLWSVIAIKRRQENRIATIELLRAKSAETKEIDVNDLVVTAEFRDYIYPGLLSTGKVVTQDNKPFHSVINGENYHALNALTYSHRGKIDAIYIDPPYNTGAKDWKYNNDYVETEDLYRHSKWLAFMERRLKIAKELLNPEKSVLILSIDEKEYLRIGLLLEQLFPEAKIQMVSTIIKPEGTNRFGEFSRTNEYIYFVMFGSMKVSQTSNDMSGREQKSKQKKIEWRNLRRRENTSIRTARPNQFYPVFVNRTTHRIDSIGDPLNEDIDRLSIETPDNCYAVFPLKPDGTEMLWGVTPASLRKLLEKGCARVIKSEQGEAKAAIQYLSTGTVKAIDEGLIEVEGVDEYGGIKGAYTEIKVMPKTTWNLDSHNAQTSGTLILTSLLPNRRFPFPKSLYAVEDCLRFFVSDNKKATILDFFAGSGTTCHAVMRLNKQDDGNRKCISITNNEVGADEQKALRQEGLRPGDHDWERLGICEYITKPRIRAAITGQTPNGDLIKGEYKFMDEFPMSDGFNENAEFFTLTYESGDLVEHNMSFEKVSPILWLRAGSQGRRIESIPSKGWDISETYGILERLDQANKFCDQISKNIKIQIVYVITDDERRFQSIVKHLPTHVEPIRLYESYLTNFQFSNGE